MDQPKKKWALKNYSEAEVLKIIDKATDSLAPKFRFTYFTTEDLKQEAVIKVLESLHKYDESKGGIEGFIWTLVHNHLFNFKRNKYNRPDSPNQAKKNVLCPIAFDNVQDLDKESNMEWSQQNDIKIDYKLISSIIDNKISIRLRPLWLKMKNGIDLTAIEKNKVLVEIHSILEDAGINTKEEVDDG